MVALAIPVLNLKSPPIIQPVSVALDLTLCSDVSAYVHDLSYLLYALFWGADVLIQHYQRLGMHKY